MWLGARVNFRYPEQGKSTIQKKELILAVKKRYVMLFEGKFTEDGFDNRITQLLGISYPIIQAGMIWASGWKLASAVSNAGGLGIIGAGSMYPAVLLKHIQKCKQATNKPFAVNLPLLYPAIDEHVGHIIAEK